MHYIPGAVNAFSAIDNTGFNCGGFNCGRAAEANLTHITMLSGDMQPAHPLLCHEAAPVSKLLSRGAAHSHCTWCYNRTIY
jgi:hypothetical protein